MWNIDEESPLIKTGNIRYIFSFQVKPPTPSNIRESQGQLDNLFAAGNVDKAMQMAFAMLSATGDSDDSESVSFLNFTKLIFYAQRTLF